MITVNESTARPPILGPAQILIAPPESFCKPTAPRLPESKLLLHRASRCRTVTARASRVANQSKQILAVRRLSQFDSSREQGFRRSRTFRRAVLRKVFWPTRPPAGISISMAQRPLSRAEGAVPVAASLDADLCVVLCQSPGPCRWSERGAGQNRCACRSRHCGAESTAVRYRHVAAQCRRADDLGKSTWTITD